MHVRTTFALAAACCFPCGVSADEADSKLLKSFVTSQTAAVATLDLSKADAAGIKAVLDLAPDKQASAAWASTIEKLRAAGVNRLYLIVTPFSLLPSEWIYLVAATSPERAATVRAALAAAPEQGMSVKEMNGGVFFGSSAVWDRVSVPPAGDDANDLLARVARTKPAPLSIVTRLPQDQRRALGELAPPLPDSLGGGSLAPLIEGFESFELNATSGARPSISLVVHARDASAANRIESIAAKAISAAKSAPPQSVPALRAVKSLAALIKPTVVENRVEAVLDLTDGNVQTAVKELADAADENTRRHKVVNDLKMIALAMHNYHDAHKSFPPGGTVDRNGKPLLSWRVHILPFLEYNALYRKFKLDEPWDSEHNRKLIDQMPKEYASRRAAKDGKTTILGFSGAGSLFPKPGEGVRINDVKDGTSNTIMCISAPASQAVVWTKPDDLSIVDPTLLTKVGVATILAAYCDGSVHTLPMPSVLKDLIPRITINGREAIPPQ